jgi:hypothetical protein
LIGSGALRVPFFERTASTISTAKFTTSQHRLVVSLHEIRFPPLSLFSLCLFSPLSKQEGGKQNRKPLLLVPNKKKKKRVLANELVDIVCGFRWAAHKQVVSIAKPGFEVLQ